MAAEFTVGDLRRQLNGLHDDDEITFAGGLSFYRLAYVLVALSPPSSHSAVLVSLSPFRLL